MASRVPPLTKTNWSQTRSRSSHRHRWSCWNHCHCFSFFDLTVPSKSTFMFLGIICRELPLLLDEDMWLLLPPPSSVLRLATLSFNSLVRSLRPLRIQATTPLSVWGVPFMVSSSKCVFIASSSPFTFGSPLGAMAASVGGIKSSASPSPSAIFSRTMVSSSPVALFRASSPRIRRRSSLSTTPMLESSRWNLPAIPLRLSRGIGVRIKVSSLDLYEFNDSPTFCMLVLRPPTPPTKLRRFSLITSESILLSRPWRPLMKCVTSTSFVLLCFFSSRR
mmetsp:Transcript_31793/g.58264  ORF Transcript_31793/g.58264 Transcript_31793/m.58264 type:complete len:277 (-) Transcript_31793:1863-2693(-)